MSGIIASNKFIAIVGLGVTGLSVARYLMQQQQRIVLLDSRDQPPHLVKVMEEFPDVLVVTGSLVNEEAQEILLSATEIIVSPGLSIADPAFTRPLAAGVPVIGDIALFARDCKKSIIAITGSNAKSTVTTLVAAMLMAAGVRAIAGGNLGVPALDLLRQDQAVDCYDVFVLELSSFQLETTPRLGAKVACVLNVSADHMDRYDSIQSYHAAKQRIYFGAETAVYNRADVLTAPPIANGVSYLTFGATPADKNALGIENVAGVPHVFFEFKALLPVKEIRMVGAHNVENALAALAIGIAFGADIDPMLEVLKTFVGLPHRCQWVAEVGGVNFYNDSKGTNVGATLAALNGLSDPEHKLVLIAGGVGKGADFSLLVPAVKENVRALVLLGRDAQLIAKALRNSTEIAFASDMREAVSMASAMAQSGDTVLLSPACASLDMYRSFEERGDDFCRQVEALC